MRSLVEFALGIASFAAALGLVLPEAPARAREISGAPTPRALPARPAQGHTASYTLKARLDPNTHRVHGEGTIEFLNTSRAPLKSLFFHLYLNAFKNDQTLFLRSPFSGARSGVQPDAFGFIDVTKLTARELPSVDLWSTRARHSPDDPADETDIEVPLPKELLPGERLTLDVSFESQLPSIVERTGHAGSFHFVGQWFPKLARLEESGEFAHFAFHPYAEFYSDFGAYDVTLDVPETFIIGASGVRKSQRVAQGRRSERYVIDWAHDFAWTAWDRFQEHTAAIAGVAVKMLVPPGHAGNVERTREALAASLPYFDKHFGAFPYPNLTVVHPPEKAGPAGGMEYPTLITTGAPWYSPYTGLRSLEAVTVHELGHQWFYGLLASNEAKVPFLDEGLTTFAEASSMEDWLGHASGARILGLSVSVWSALRAYSQDRAEDEPVAQPAAAFSSFANLGALVYGRTGLLLETLARVYGRERLNRALLDYAESFRFRHPTPADLLAKIEAHVGPSARAALEQGLFARGRVNYLAYDLISAKKRPRAGYFERADGTRERIVPNPLLPTEYTSRVTVYRQGALELPVEVRLIAEDGTQKTERWDGRGAFHAFEYTGATPLSRAIIDPERRIVIDDKLFDNQVRSEPAGTPRVSERLAYWAALALGSPLP